MCICGQVRLVFIWGNGRSGHAVWRARSGCLVEGLAWVQ